MSQLKTLIILLGLLSLSSAFLINGYIHCDGTQDESIQAELIFKNISIPLDSNGHFQLEVPDNTFVFFRILHPGCHFETSLLETYPGCKRNYHFQGMKKSLWTRKMVLLMAVVFNLVVLVTGCLLWWFKDPILKLTNRDGINYAEAGKENV
ncbi:unnamed protein product [Ceutorhynchus assimilis]|uniref:Uncharacterized protein n=1 Tax=Ceutorhynchus assimilis TaxID=467358 RepID=A0A9N9MEI6_9CUCU|nr:unnamed protein product [Ceutorhynchus assimilis]